MEMYCPNPDCINHHPKSQIGWYVKRGVRHNDSGKVNLFQCKECLRRFSDRYFSIDYHAHNVIDYPLLVSEIQSGSSLRAISRKFGCSVKVIQNRFSRLARNIMAFNSDLYSTQILYEDLVADGIINFVNSQYFPTEINILVGAHSKVIYAFTYSLTKRRGVTTEKQKKRIESIYENVDFENYTITKGFTKLMESTARLTKSSTLPNVILHTDMKKQYQTALHLNEQSRLLIAQKKLSHQITRSTVPRTKSNPLEPVNYIDREMRKDLAGFHRETVCQPRNIVNCCERLLVYFFYHNTEKRFLINSPESEKDVKHIDEALFTPDNISAMKKIVYTGRRIFSEVKEKLSGFDREVWRKTIPTPGKPNVNYIPNFALM